MNGISSYALKTVVMNMIAEQPNKDWKPSQKAGLFLEVSDNSHSEIALTNENWQTFSLIHLGSREACHLFEDGQDSLRI